MRKQRAQISFAVTVKLISAIVFDTRSTISLLPKSKISSFQPSSVLVQVALSDLVGISKDLFSSIAAHIVNFSANNYCDITSAMRNFKDITRQSKRGRVANPQQHSPESDTLQCLAISGTRDFQSEPQHGKTNNLHRQKQGRR